MNINWVQDTVLGIEDKMKNRNKSGPCSLGLTVLKEREDWDIQPTKETEWSYMPVCSGKPGLSIL